MFVVVLDQQYVTCISTKFVFIYLGKADIVFVLDSSVGTGKKEFKTALDFMVGVTSNLGIGRAGVNVGLIVISSKPRVVFDFKKNRDVPSLRKRAGRVRYPGAGSKSKAGTALKLAKSVLFPSSKRKDAAKVIITIISSESLDDVSAPAAALKATGVTSFVIGMGQGFSQPQVDSVATSPQHQMTNIDYSSLMAITPVITDKLKNGKSLASLNFLYCNDIRNLTGFNVHFQRQCTLRTIIYTITTTHLSKIFSDLSFPFCTALGLPDSEGNRPNGKPIKPGRPGGPQKTKGILTYIW